MSNLRSEMDGPAVRKTHWIWFGAGAGIAVPLTVAALFIGGFLRTDGTATEAVTAITETSSTSSASSPATSTPPQPPTVDNHAALAPREAVRGLDLDTVVATFPPQLREATVNCRTAGSTTPDGAIIVYCDLGIALSKYFSAGASIFFTASVDTVIAASMLSRAESISGAEAVLASPEGTGIAIVSGSTPHGIQYFDGITGLCLDIAYFDNLENARSMLTEAGLI